MISFTAAIDYRNLAAGDDFLQVTVVQQASHNGAYISGQVFGLIFNAGQNKIGCCPANVYAVTTQLSHGDLERDTGTGTGLLEDHGQGLVGQQGPEVTGVLFDFGGFCQDILDVFAGQVFEVS